METMTMRDEVAEYEAGTTQALPIEQPAEVNMGALLSNALDEIDCGVMLIDATNKILYANHAARIELNEASRIQIRNARLAAASLRNASAMEDAARDAAKGLQRFIRVSASKADLTLAYSPVRGTHSGEPAMPNAAPAILVMIGRQEASNPALLTAFAKMYRLSATEQQLLPAICDGASAKEITQTHGTSVFTIRSHLKNIRTKTGVSSLRKLVVRLMSFPPIRPRP